MNRLMNRLADARPARLDPEAGAGLDPAEIMAHPRPARAERRLPRRLVLAGLVPMAAVATAVAVLAIAAAPPEPPAPTAHDVLLVAAERAGTERAAGTWWVTNAVNGFRDLPEGSYLKFGPLTPGRRFPLGQVDPLTRIDVTTAELAAAPTDPARLRAWLTDRIRRAGSEPTGGILFRAGESLVMHLPVTPPLRAAAYRMLAGLDGVHSLGPVTDRHGRAGTAVAFDYTGRADPMDPASPVGPMQVRLIIDLPTGRALAMESYSLHGGTATLQRYTVMLSSYYTDRPPAPPR